MGHARPRPARLAEKLLQIRVVLGLSQSGMHQLLGVGNLIEYHAISKFERGVNEPSLAVLLQYARVVGVNMEVLADDTLELPERLPGPTDHAEIRRRFAPRRQSKR